MNYIFGSSLSSKQSSEASKSSASQVTKTMKPSSNSIASVSKPILASSSKKVSPSTSSSSSSKLLSKRLYEEHTSVDYSEAKKAKVIDNVLTSKTKNWSSKEPSQSNDKSRASFGKIKMFSGPATTPRPSQSSSKSSNDVPVSPEHEIIPIGLELGKLYAPRKKHLRSIYESLLPYVKNGEDSRKEIIKAAKDIEYKVYQESSKSTSGYHSKIASKMVSIRKCNTLQQFYEAIAPPKVLTAFEKLTTPMQVTVCEQLLHDEDTLYNYGFWFRTHESDPEIYIANKDKDPVCMTANVTELTPESMVKCSRCNLPFQHDKQNSQCRFHDGVKQFKLKADKTYSCCNEGLTALGCTIEDWHTFTGNEFRHVRTEFEPTPWANLGEDSPLSAYAIDCEMIFTTRGHELARVTLIDFDGKMVFDWFVETVGRVVDYVTKWSGITEELFKAATRHSFEEVRQELFKYINSKTFVIGHGLDSDLKILKLIHLRVLDTTILFPHKFGPPYKKKLKLLVQEHLFKTIQEEDATGHDSLEDSLAALQLVKLKLNDLASK